MTIGPGVHTYGPRSATLTVETGRRGAAAKAGHDLVIEVTDWEATLEVGDDGTPTALSLGADPRSLRVREGRGGIQDLKREDIGEIEGTIDREVLGGHPIELRSTAIDPADGGRRLRVSGTLAIAGQSRPVELELELRADGGIAGEVTLKQSDWGITPYSGLFGALKVADEVKVVAEARAPQG
ncbi:MAG TPA: YceI family protein [Solirubrobacterales bacterium]|nr:YceI family protein [Solirubrobacterales bacterium]